MVHAAAALSCHDGVVVVAVVVLSAAEIEKEHYGFPRELGVVWKTLTKICSDATSACLSLHLTQ